MLPKPDTGPAETPPVPPLPIPVVIDDPPPPPPPPCGEQRC
jgi:hypothetical protein